MEGDALECVQGRHQGTVKLSDVTLTALATPDTLDLWLNIVAYRSAEVARPEKGASRIQVRSASCRLTLAQSDM